MSRHEIAKVLNSSGALEVLLRARHWSDPGWLTVITYHRVHDDPDGQQFDQGVIDCSRAQLRRHVSILKRYFSVVALPEVCGLMEQGKPLPPNPAIITFDDGYRECFENALPVLHEAGVPATFFIATSYVSQRRVFWWDRISYTLRRCELPRIRIRYPLPLELSLGGNADRATQQLLRYAKSHYELDMDRFLDELSAAAEVPWDVDTERRFSDELVMTWDHIRTLKKLGMDIQSHTRTHRILQNMPMSELFGELAGSRADLEEQIGAPVIAVSYPVGRSVARYPAIRFAAREAGYKVGFSNANGVTLLRGTYDPFDLHRIAVESNFPDHYFRALLAIPRLSESL